MLKIALITNFNIPEKANAASVVADRLLGKECRILIAAFNKEKLMRVGKHRDEFVYMPLEAVYSEADVIIVLGGDGSIIQAAHRSVASGIPIVGINCGRLGYMAEIVRSGIMSINEGQFEAGRSLGFDYKNTMWYIILPQAFKNILPALANEFIVLLKETSVAGYVTIRDLTMGGNIIRAATYSPFMPLIAVAIIYLVLVMFFTKLVSILERRLRKSER